MVRGITYILDTDAGVRALVGRNKADTKYKVFPVAAGQDEEPPYIVVRRTAHLPEQCHIGRPTTFGDRYEVISYHKNYEDAISLDLAVQDALDGKSSTYNTIVFDEIRHENSFDGDFDGHVYSAVSTFIARVNEDQAT